MTKRVLNPDQMRLFMRPGEIKEAVTMSVDLRGEGMTRLWERKEQESRARRGDNRSAGLYDRLLTEQVRDPVTLMYHPGVSMGEALTMEEGHHRVAASHAVERAMRGSTTEERYIPVQYKQTYEHSGHA